VSQLPTAVAPLVVNGISTNDQTASGYFDVGTMRIQWGSHNDGNVDTTTVTMPAAFANTNYIVNCTSNNGVAGSASAEAKTTTTFDIDRASTTVALNIWGWICIGLKP
jgi:nitrous oxide reductase